MIADEKVPTLAIARQSFGLETVKTILIAYLHKTAIAYGFDLSNDAADEIAGDIASGFPYLKLTEIMLAFKMMREASFREGSGDSNRGRMYGSLSTAVICDCIHRFVVEKRNPILEQIEKEQRDAKRIEDDSKTATPEQKFNIVGGAYLYDTSNKYILQFLTNNQKMTLEYYAKEREALQLLKKRVEEYLSTPDGERSTESLSKGIEYINKNFPFDPIKYDVV